MTDPAVVTIQIPVAALRGACKAWEHVFEVDEAQWKLQEESQDYLALFFAQVRELLVAIEQEGG